MKTVKVITKNNQLFRKRYGWEGNTYRNCILSIYKNYGVEFVGGELKHLISGEVEPYAESIRRIDDFVGGDSDLALIRELAEKLDMKVEVIE